MKLPQIISSGIYRKKQYVKQTFYMPHIYLYISGLKW